ncbi:MAG TPA: pitrilysin family protein [Pyrinomonadaceae bacterium]|nr:pitrilysin family protein [Pyrinomonadaceae bacterium]
MFRQINSLMSAALLLCGALTLPLAAQNTKPQHMNQTEEFRRQAPAPLPHRPLNIPKPFETTLPNGLQVVIVEDKRLPLVSYRLAFRTGNAHDPAGLPGLTVMVTNLLNEGTESRTSKQIAEEIARIGATLMAGSNADYTTVAASALSMFSDEILDLMADVTLRPSFPEKEVELSKQNTKEGLKQQRAQASFLANERLSQIIFGQHPYANIAPTPESVDAMTREKMIHLHRSMFVPNNAVLIVVGDVERNALLKRVNELFGKWGKGPATDQKFPAPPARTSRAIYLVDRPGSAQSNIVIANMAINRTSPDYFPMLLMHTILGANASSRLFMNLREDKGYTYGAYTTLDARRETGSFRESAEVRTPVTGASLKEFFDEIKRIRTEPVSEKEINDAKAYLTGVFPIRIETQEGLIDQLVQIKMFGLPADYLHTYSDRVNAVTVADIQRVARQYLLPDQAAVVIVGDAAAIMDQVKPYSQTIELYDTLGQRKELNGKGGSAATGATVGPADLSGTWALEIAVPSGQTMPATLTIKQDGETLTGSVQSQFGESPLSNVKRNGNGFDASLTLNMQGQEINAKVAGSAENDRIKGSIDLNIPNFPPLSFTGIRSKQ